nr:UvrD-helicase domain-containing protein [Acholeplasmatales bacterium]
IARMSIQLLENNKDICEEVKNQYKEILIDEYQDTSDMQEKFMSLISHDNLFMVGDIKQSIYRFRHANPNNFKEKYDTYDKLYEEDNEHQGKVKNKLIDFKNAKGLRIDMTQNFRSRSEVLNNINNMFSVIMTQDHGDARFEESHQMIYGGLYTEKEANRDYNMKILNYDKKEASSFNNDEIEAFIVAQDILKRIKNKQTVQYNIDKDTKGLRPIEFKDFCIICDRSKEFKTLEAVLQHFNIPVSINKNEDVTESSLLSTVFSIIKGISLTYLLHNEVKNNASYWHAVLSIYRSFLLKDKYSDNYTFDIVMSKNLDNEVSIKLKELANLIDEYSNTQIYNTALESFNFFKELNKVGSINKSMHEVEYIFNMIESLSKMGYHFTTISDYIDDTLNSDSNLNYSLDHSDDPGVKIMNIHKSKGLEFAVCYFLDLDHGPNLEDCKHDYGFDSDYAIYLPAFVKDDNSEGLRKTAQAILNNYYSEKATLSERIRLFYVALTRAKEEMVLVYPKIELNELKLMPNKITKFSELINMYRLSSGYPTIDVDIKTINLTHDYMDNNKEINIKDNGPYSYKTYSFDSNVVETSHISKTINEITDESTRFILEYGSKFHEVMESIDFKNPDLSKIDLEFKDKVTDILNNDLMKNISKANTYHEHEFVFEDNNVKYHGIIDLLAVYDDHVDIIDYKLSNAEHEEYKRQLAIYKEYVKRHTDLPINCYLLSLNQNKIKKVD